MQAFLFQKNPALCDIAMEAERMKNILKWFNMGPSNIIIFPSSIWMRDIQEEMNPLLHKLSHV